MFLKTLQIKGFKSFADAATLQLEPGVTVVVGPNGSGKSNVVDAIGWVLGAQAPSAVRSQKMDDVIFAGAAKRQALGRAEVSLTIDNSDGILPIEFNEVTITRLLFRSGDSEYSINGAPCRLLDIQELLSDTGVGRQQHVIISQGNIDAILNARPEDRRLVIEEAAGVLKYRRRKERAERRLSATETNLTRIQDLLREVRRQLRPLERQADAARRHGALKAEHDAIKLHVAGRDLDRLRTRLADSAREQHTWRDEERTLVASLADADARLLAVEAELTAVGGRDVGDALLRYETLRERSRGLVALLNERRRSLGVELDATVDADVIASLEGEQAQLRNDLRQITADGEAVLVEDAQVVETEQTVAVQRSRFEAEWGQGVEAPSGEAAGIRGELAALRAAVGRTTADRERLELRRDSLAGRVARLAAELGTLGTDLETTQNSAPQLDAAVESAESARAQAEDAQTAAEVAATDAEAEHSAWSARAEALAQALDAAREAAGVARLTSLDGVLGTLLDLVDVDSGWEQAFEAAVSDALGAVVVADVAAGRRALAALAEGDHRGAVLALDAARGPAPGPPSAGESLRGHVRPAPSAPTGLSGLLDALVGSAVVVDGGWERAVAVAMSNPGAVVVTRGGDRFGASGWRIGAASSGATGAALEEAQARVVDTVAARESARAAVTAARVAVADARRAEQEAVKARDTAASRVRSLTETLARATSDRDEAHSEHESTVGHLAELVERHGREQERVAELEGRLPALEAAEADLTEQARRMAEARSALEEAATSVSARRAELAVRMATTDEARRFVTERLEQIGERLARQVADRDAATDRRQFLEAKVDATERLLAFVEARRGVVESHVTDLQEERRRQSEAARSVTSRLEVIRNERRGGETQLGELRLKLQQAEVADAETQVRVEGVAETIRTELDVDPETAVAAECPPLPEGTTAPARLRELERELRLMGPINPLALQEFEELQERHQFYETQLEDIRTTRKDLNKVIRAVDEEIVKVFTAAYADVSENFVSLFETLFPGGQGQIRLTDPSNLLETGIEIEARPSGKNVRKLSLLSGGERSLTALAYLFAVFRSRPSPFYVMDEVEAALDDVNLHRFLDLIAEFRDTAQLLIVSHQKRTMEAADVLYGVTMEPGGSTKVVSEKASAVLD